MIPKQAIKEYQQIYERVYKQPISYKEAKEQGERLLKLIRALAKPKN
jgi:hypothetical protein